MKSFHHLAPDQTVLLGSFSKTVVPGFRIGWVAAPEKLCDKLLIAKQAADLHTCNFTQYVLVDFLTNNQIENHLKTIRAAYGSQCRAMLEAIERDFPDYVSCTSPHGGMFLWGRLPEKMSSLELFDRAVARKVVFVPGEPFYTRATRSSSFRLNFSCTDERVIDEGIGRLAEAIVSMESASR
jgi:2-aminoadipate transaminase